MLKLLKMVAGFVIVLLQTKTDSATTHLKCSRCSSAVPHSVITDTSRCHPECIIRCYGYGATAIQIAAHIHVVSVLWNIHLQVNTIARLGCCDRTQMVQYLYVIVKQHCIMYFIYSSLTTEVQEINLRNKMEYHSSH
jgi:hypothetical protein